MKKAGIILILSIISSVIWLPLFMMVGNSFMGITEIKDSFGVVLTGMGEELSFSIIPEYPTLKPYVELLLDSPGFYAMFWNSCKQVFGILAGLCFISIPAAWAFGRYDFFGKKVLFTLYMILMIMPFQVTMVSNYLVLDQFRLLDTHWAIILPGVFSTFPVFILSKFFKAIPDSLIEAAELDGAGEMKIFMALGIPLGVPGIMSALILSFLEYWNAMEQPLTFLRNKSLWPMSLYLPNITSEKVGVAFAASVAAMIPPLLLFLFGQSCLEQGIEDRKSVV